MMTDISFKTTLRAVCLMSVSLNKKKQGKIEYQILAERFRIYKQMWHVFSE